MNVIVPIEITDARLTSSTVPEVAPAAYAAGTTYALDAQVSVAGTLGAINVYQSLAASNIGNTPGSSPTFWQFIGVTYVTHVRAGVQYSLKDRVIDPVTHKTYECIANTALNVPLNQDVTPVWASTGGTSLVLPAAFDFAVTYAADALVYSTVFGYYNGIPTPIENYVYRSRVGGNVGHIPFRIDTTYWEVLPSFPVPRLDGIEYVVGRVVKDGVNTYTPLLTPNKTCPLDNRQSWLLVGTTNKMAMFDGKRSTATVAPSPLMFTVTPGVYFNAIALLKCVAQTAVITVKNGATTIYTQTITLQNRKVFDWYDWFFKPFSQQKNIIIFNLSPISGNTVTVTLSGSGNVECGRFAVGNSTYLGEAEYGAGADVDNYSVIERNAFGEVTSLVSRANVPKTAQTLYIDKSKVNDILEMREATPATPLIWVGIPDTTDAYSDSLCINGIYRRFAVNLAYPEKAKIDLQLEEI